MSEQPNPYAAPIRGSEHTPAPGGFRLSDDLRRQIAKVARLMFVAGGLQISATTISLINEGISIPTLASAALTGVFPLFVLLAGISLLAIAKRDEGNDLGALLAGFRQLHVAMVVKGVMLILVVALGLFGIVAAFFFAKNFVTNGIL